MKIYTAQQIRTWEAQTLKEQGITSYELMERAATAFCDWWVGHYDVSRPIVVLCGAGHNGGDGLAIARLLSGRRYDVSVYCVEADHSSSADVALNRTKLAQTSAILRGGLGSEHPMPVFPLGAVAIDALWGIGLSRPLSDFWVKMADYLAESGVEVVAVDLPSGIFADGQPTPHAFFATHTVSFQVPKIAFFMPENEVYIGEWHVVDIGLSSDFDAAPWAVFVSDTDIKKRVQQRSKFAHKGLAGRALLVCGSYGMAGAAVLSARACLRSGVGLLTIQSPQSNRVVLQTAVPEAMVRADADEFVVSQNVSVADIDALGLGCGLGRAGRTAAAVQAYLSQTDAPVVLDADGLNLLSANPHWWSHLTKNCIFTPHLKEFERLFGAAANQIERLEKLRAVSEQRGITVVLKGAYTAVATPDGGFFINSTGNPGMATGGSGDVLTGILTALLAQGYTPQAAAVVGVFVHGRAGDLAAAQVGQISLLASDIVDALGRAFLSLQEKS